MNIHKAAGIIIKERQVLLTRAKGKEIFVSPGGKLNNGETYKQALIRELLEELQIQVNEADLEEFGRFKAVAADDEKRIIKMNAYIVKSFSGVIVPANEIEEIVWIDSKNHSKIKIGSIFKYDILPNLKEQGLID